MSSNLSNPITRNKNYLFSFPSQRSTSKENQQTMEPKKDCNLCSQLYVSFQRRGGDLDTFFSHENQTFPPSVSQLEKLRSSSKLDLLKCFEQHVDTIAVNGTAIINMFKPEQSKRFKDYATDVFLPCVQPKSSAKSPAH